MLACGRGCVFGGGVREAGGGGENANDYVCVCFRFVRIFVSVFFVFDFEVFSRGDVATRCVDNFFLYFFFFFHFQSVFFIEI